MFNLRYVRKQSIKRPSSSIRQARALLTSNAQRKQKDVLLASLHSLPNVDTGSVLPLHGNALATCIDHAVVKQQASTLGAVSCRSKVQRRVSTVWHGLIDINCFLYETTQRKVGQTVNYQQQHVSRALEILANINKPPSALLHYWTSLA